MMLPSLPCICTCPLAFQKCPSISVLLVILCILANSLPYITFSERSSLLAPHSHSLSLHTHGAVTEHSPADMAGCSYDCFSPWLTGADAGSLYFWAPRSRAEWALRNGP